MDSISSISTIEMTTSSLSPMILNAGSLETINNQPIVSIYRLSKLRELYIECAKQLALFTMFMVLICPTL